MPRRPSFGVVVPRIGKVVVLGRVPDVVWDDLATLATDVLGVAAVGDAGPFVMPGEVLVRRGTAWSAIPLRAGEGGFRDLLRSLVDGGRPDRCVVAHGDRVPPFVERLLAALDVPHVVTLDDVPAPGEARRGPGYLLGAVERLVVGPRLVVERTLDGVVPVVPYHRAALARALAGPEAGGGRSAAPDHAGPRVLVLAHDAMPARGAAPQRAELWARDPDAIADGAVVDVVSATGTCPGGAAGRHLVVDHGPQTRTGVVGESHRRRLAEVGADTVGATWWPYVLPWTELHGPYDVVLVVGVVLGVAPLVAALRRRWGATVVLDVVDGPGPGVHRTPAQVAGHDELWRGVLSDADVVVARSRPALEALPAVEVPQRRVVVTGGHDRAAVGGTTPTPAARRSPRPLLVHVGPLPDDPAAAALRAALEATATRLLSVDGRRDGHGAAASVLVDETGPLPLREVHGVLAAADLAVVFAPCGEDPVPLGFHTSLGWAGDVLVVGSPADGPVAGELAATVHGLDRVWWVPAEEAALTEFLRHHEPGPSPRVGREVVSWRAATEQLRSAVRASTEERTR